MIFVNSPYDLQYHKRTPGDPCYCEWVLTPADMTLQGFLPSPAAGVKVFLYSADGLSEIAEVTDSFLTSMHVFSGVDYFITTVKSWAIEMCQNPCFVLRVQAQMEDGALIFDKYTEQYCLDSCCMPPGMPDVSAGATLDLSSDLASNAGAVIEVARPCARETHVLEAEFDCYDPFSGMVFDGQGRYRQRSVIEATFRQMPREITRQISGKGRIQKTESTRKYELWSFEIFPTWKMDEIENMLHAPRLWLDGHPFTFSGGTPFERIHKCKDWHRLKVLLENAQLWQNTSCEPGCATDEPGAKRAYYAFPENAEAYRDDAGRLIAYELEDVKAWFSAQTGTASVERVEEPLPIPVDLLRVESTEKLPAFLYHDKPIPANRVYAKYDSSADPDYYAILGLPYGFVPCKTPEIGELSFRVYECQTPEVSGSYFTDSCALPQISETQFS